MSSAFADTHSKMRKERKVDIEFVEPRVLAVPYEEGVYWRKGTKDGPEAILREAPKIREFSLILNRRNPYLLTDILFPSPAIEPYSKLCSLEKIERSVDSLLADGYAPVIVGGDHSITLPIIRSLANAYGAKQFGIMHFDAHSDTFDAVDNFEFHHGAVFRHIVEEGLVAPENIFQFGIRGFVRGDGLTFANRKGIRYVLMDEFRAKGCNLAAYCSHEMFYFVSIDIDAVDPAFAPGTGTPVPGGFTSSEILDVVRQLVNYQVIGLDLVEVAPVFDHANITVLLAAHLLVESLSGIHFVKPTLVELA